MILKLLKFPGILVHEFSHYIMCKFLGVKVSEFHVSIKNTEGHVVFNVPKSIVKSMLISIAPLFFGIIFVKLMFMLEYENVIFFVFQLYFAFVVIYFAFPSKEDTNFFLHHNLLKKIVTFPFFLVFRLIYYIQYNEFLFKLLVVLMIGLVYLY